MNLVPTATAGSVCAECGLGCPGPPRSPVPERTPEERCSGQWGQHLALLGVTVRSWSALERASMQSASSLESPGVRELSLSQEIYPSSPERKACPSLEIPGETAAA